MLYLACCPIRILKFTEHSVITSSFHDFQILLPAIFVAVAMTVALAAPSVDDLPPLELSPTQFTNVTLPTGNFIPFTDERMSKP